METVSRSHSPQQVPVDLDRWLKNLAQRADEPREFAPRQNVVCVQPRGEYPQWIKDYFAEGDRQRAPQPPRGESQHRSSAPRRVGPHVAVQKRFEASAPWQYALPDDGRKYRGLCVRRRRLAVYLAAWRVIRMSLPRMVRDMKWSESTVKRTLHDLCRLGVLEAVGRVGLRAPRLRKLHPEALRSQPLVRESDRVTSRESDRQELPERLQNYREKNQNRDFDKATNAQNAFSRVFDLFLERPKPAQPQPQIPVRENRKDEPQHKPEPPVELSADVYSNLLRVLNALTIQWGADKASHLLGWIEQRIQSRAASHSSRVRTVGYFIKSANRFMETAPDWQIDWVLDHPRYDLAGRHGFAFHQDTQTWQFSLGALAKHDLALRMKEARSQGRTRIDWQPTLARLIEAAREHKLDWDNASLLATTRHASESLGFQTLGAAA